MKSFQIMLLLSALVMQVCFLTGVLRFDRLRGSLRLLVLQTGMGLSMDAIGILTARPGASNHAYFNVYIPLEFVVALFAMGDYCGLWFGRLSGPAVALFLIVFAFDLHSSGPHLIAYHAISLGYLILGLTYLAALSINVHHRDRRGIGLIAGPAALYYLCTIPGFGLTKIMLTLFPEPGGIVTDLQIGLNVVRYAGCTLGIWYLSHVHSETTSLKRSS